MSERWKPERTESYYYIKSNGEVATELRYDDEYDYEYYERGNCFRTKEEAESAAEKIRELLLSLHEEQQVTDCTTLPKLTTEVFNREDCPSWAKYATLNSDGTAQWYNKRPSFNHYNNMWYPDCTDCCTRAIEGEFDATDWQNSLIERSVTETKLPDWCKVGEWCYCHDDDGNPKYFKITVIKDNYIYGEDWDIDYHFIRQAHLRPFNTKEMKALVGRTVAPDYGAVFLVTKFVDTDEGGEVCIDGIYYNNDRLLDEFTIDGNPCGKLEHLNEKGEWVE